MSYHVNRQWTTNMKKRHDSILGTIPPHNFPDKLIVVHFASVKLRNEITSSSKSVMKLIWVLLVTALALLQPFSSNAARKVQRGKFVVKQITNKLKTVCPSQNKNLSQVLSIVSSVDLTLRFTHSRISSLESAAKRMKKGKPAYFVKNEYKIKTNINLFLFCFCQLMQCYCIAWAKWTANWMA